MTTYYVYLLDLKDRIIARREVECPDDATALLAARALLSLQPAFPAAEVWDRERKVARVKRAPDEKER